MLHMTVDPQKQMGDVGSVYSPQSKLAGFQTHNVTFGGRDLGLIVLLNWLFYRPN